MDIEERIKRNRVFILGAGFSESAGIPLTQNLLHQTMQMFSSECPDIFTRVDNYAKECFEESNPDLDYSKISFSKLCTFLEYIELREYGGGERWSDSGSREKLALKYYLAKTIVKNTPCSEDIPKLYLDFVGQLHEGDVVISFNWDGLLENALSYLNKPYAYNNRAKGAIELIKMHGSVNWRLGIPARYGEPTNTLDWQPFRFTDGMMDSDIYHTPVLLNYNMWYHYSPLGEVQPFLIIPGYGKAFDVRCLAPIWYKPEFAFTASHDVYIIGLGLADDDFFIRSFFLSNLPYMDSFSGVDGRKIFIINPASNAKDNYNFVLSKGNAKLLSEPFTTEHISLIKDRFQSK